MKKLSVSLLLFALLSTNTLLAGTTYYVDSIAGNNANNGTSSATAWKDFTNVNTKTFLPGDHLLLRSGCTWDSELHLNGSGAAGNFIIVDAYGTGNKPKIQRNGAASDRTVFMTNPSYWDLRNLEICNAGDGIEVNYTGKGYSSLYFESLYIHNIDIVVDASPSTPDGIYYSTGININNGVSAAPSTFSDYVATDVRIVNCEIAFTTAPFTFLHVFTNPSGSNTESPWSYSNIIVDNNYLHDYKGPISTRDMNNAVVTNNTCKRGGTMQLPQGTTGFFDFDLENVVFEGNIMDSVPNTSSGDQCWVDNEAYCDNVKFYGNRITNTAGTGIEFLSLGSGANPPRGSDDHNTNNSVDGNTFFNNAGGCLRTAGSGAPIPSGFVGDNFYESGNTFFNGSYTGFTLTNNVTASASATNLAAYKACIASSNWDSNQRASKAFDTSSTTDWQSAPGTFSGQWLRVNFGTPTTFDSVTLSEYGNRTSGYQIQYSNDGINWTTAYTGTTIGASKTITFTAVTGTSARIYFTSGTSTPIIYQFGIYKKPSPTLNLARYRTYSSSSNWDASMTADQAFDSNYVTNWQSGMGTSFPGQWLEVNFGSAVTFDSVRLYEYGNRTSGYRIEYSTNGTTWSTAYTGTTIGASKAISFTAVTGNYARIYFTSGTNTPIIFEFEIYKIGAVLGTSILSGPVTADPGNGFASANKDLFLAPNPASGRVKLAYSATTPSELTIAIYSASGAPVKVIGRLTAAAGLNQYDIDVSELRPGTYFVRLMAKGSAEVRKLIIVR